MTTRKAYWQEGHLEKNKIRRIMKSSGLSEKEARVLWRDSKKNYRVKKVEVSQKKSSQKKSRFSGN